jgi:thiol:disulfide interchange protein DsbA
VFIALHEQRVTFKTDEAVFSWVAGKGADAKKFTDAFNGFSMASRVTRGDQEATGAKIGGVPSLAVDGKYLVNNEAASNYEDLLRITDAVIAKARQDRKGK